MEIAGFGAYVAIRKPQLPMSTTTTTATKKAKPKKPSQQTNKQTWVSELLYV